MWKEQTIQSAMKLGGKVLERLALEYYQIDISTSLLELILKFGQLKNTLTQ